MLPYRKCSAIFLIKNGKIFVGQRTDSPGAWQLPQGGLNEGENYLEAAKRELFEETNVKSIQLIGSTSNLYKYDFPEFAQQRVLKKYGRLKFVGQELAFFVFKFLGGEQEIDLEPKEFSDWKWCTLKELMNEIVDFKRNAYEGALQELNQLRAFL